MSCEACAARRYLTADVPLATKPILYSLEYSLPGPKFEARNCETCGQTFFAVPLSRWADLIQEVAYS